MASNSEFMAEASIEAPAEAVFAWHERPGALERLTPPWERFRVLEQHGGIRDGDRLVARVGVLGGLGPRWEAVHRDYEAGKRFVDEQVTGPFKRWVHSHEVRAEGESRAVLRDQISYALPLGALGRVFGGPFVRSKLERMFRYRHAVTQSDLAHHQAYAEKPRMKIAMTGASGLLGKNLTAFLTLGGHEVVPLVRRREQVREHAKGGAIYWNPAAGEIDTAALEGVDAVVHLAGESVAERWTPTKKKRIYDSRVDGTRLIAETIAAAQRKPKVFVSASAIGYYGDTGDTVVDEDAPAGEGFLADVCRAWERETTPAEDAGIRTVRVRIGVVLTLGGGALEQMITPFKLGLGGKLGPGSAYVSFIGLDDLLGVMNRALMDETTTGPVNAVAPNPVTYAELSATLGRVLHRPSFMRVPSFALRLMLGAEAAGEMLLAGQRVRPSRLLDAGFEFQTPTLEETLRHALGR